MKILQLNNYFCNELFSHYFRCRISYCIVLYFIYNISRILIFYCLMVNYCILYSVRIKSMCVIYYSNGCIFLSKNISYFNIKETVLHSYFFLAYYFFKATELAILIASFINLGCIPFFIFSLKYEGRFVLLSFLGKDILTSFNILLYSNKSYCSEFY